MSNKLLLIEPSYEYKDKFLKAVKDYKNANENVHYNLYKPALENFKQFVNDLQDHAKGKNLPKGWRRYSTYWLITSKTQEIIGIIRIRNKPLKIYGHIGYDVPPSYRGNGYGTKLLKLSLEKAKQMNIKKLMVTCDEDNIGSIKIIEKNSGKFVDKVFDKEDQVYVNRYKINIE
ncbi:putative acetyltransferase [Halanaerobium saccharolyticum]|jgi:predicted acetyltransferase|uniref:Putative acetyltransferase n=1 Tax=Halanaerobium saccharolyticum TaxID=43595 RepID=A0A2T5RIY9_9FIRM|nr:GNAT family N-acetyltransferase [Halanaerobium saccharolyticum]PTV98378.1 putative acetyltransferase [Halanaerobium saccharolyticum]TDP88919.1 putative acetyltransferase [Halanaerobium saccharolyticum]